MEKTCKRDGKIATRELNVVDLGCKFEFEAAFKE